MKAIITHDLASPKTRGKRLKYIREHVLNISRPEFCKNTSIHPQSLKGWELAWGGGLKEKGAEKFAKRVEELGIYCSIHWLLYGIGSQPTAITVSSDVTKSEDIQIAKELLLFREQLNAIDVVIDDDGMIPLVYPKDYVAGIIIKDFSKTVDQECIIVTESNHIYVRVLKPADQPEYFSLVCLNQHTSLSDIIIKQAEIKEIAPIIWIRRRNHDLYVN